METKPARSPVVLQGAAQHQERQPDGSAEGQRHESCNGTRQAVRRKPPHRLPVTPPRDTRPPAEAMPGKRKRNPVALLPQRGDPGPRAGSRPGALGTFDARHVRGSERRRAEVAAGDFRLPATLPRLLLHHVSGRLKGPASPMRRFPGCPALARERGRSALEGAGGGSPWGSGRAACPPVAMVTERCFAASSQALGRVFNVYTHKHTYTCIHVNRCIYVCTVRI